MKVDRRYKGNLIRWCTYQGYDQGESIGTHRGRWYVQTYHAPTGNPWGEENCPHYATLGAAKDAIDAEIAYRPTG